MDIDMFEDVFQACEPRQWERRICFPGNMNINKGTYMMDAEVKDAIEVIAEFLIEIFKKQNLFATLVLKGIFYEYLKI